MDKDYPVEVQNYILENNYDNSEFLELIKILIILKRKQKKLFLV